MRRLVLAALMVLLAGCQSNRPPVTALTFMNLWNAYDHCQSSTDLETMRADIRRLTEAVASLTTLKDDPIRPLLRPIEHWITPSVPRLAADPKATAAACTLHTGQVAMAVGRPDLAAEVFITVIRNYPQPQYAFYVERAWRALAELQELKRGPKSGA